eukprot:TRINITY_DN9304_c0_g1_i7.p1 TRINITY_DN9304_c0_g1~~TRINITY_DN9304_c0_g1_i7.p1  ORF type:complete len:160 (+),score=15.73 TRINITY_DN9304_c0_g1_i7:239-718(+)
MGLKAHKSVVLLGGLAKDSNIENSNGFEKLVEPLKYHRCVITFGYSGKMIQKTLYDAGLTIPCIRVAKLEDAVNSARSIAKSGDAIVLSPGCASFDEFRNFVHRGKVFQELAFFDPLVSVSTCLLPQLNWKVFKRRKKVTCTHNLKVLCHGLLSWKAHK